jgi:DNA invertase Pin-like site-specific DNA recombinase
MQNFAYARVSTIGQTSENQILEMRQAGYEPQFVYQETISGKVPARERPEFVKLIDAIERAQGSKQLIVSKIDRLGRDAADIMATVKLLDSMKCGVKVLQLGDIDLTSAGGKIILATLSAVAEVERDVLIERTQAGLRRAKAEGKHLGRPSKTTESQRKEITRSIEAGVSVAQIAREHSVSRMTVMRVRDNALRAPS